MSVAAVIERLWCPSVIFAAEKTIDPGGRRGFSGWVRKGKDSEKSRKTSTVDKIYSMSFAPNRENK
jgi:hypothetical protein